jgi:predicted transcriptional regulator
MTHAQLLVQSLQGTRAQILFAFLFAGHSMDVDELRTWTGRDRKTHYGHLNALCVVGLLARQTAAHGRDVYVLGSEMLPALQAWVAQIGVEIPQLDDGPQLLQESAFRTPGAESIIIIDSSSTYLNDSVNNNNKGQESAFRTPAELDALNAALNKHKIVGTKRTELIAREHVTAEYVHAHVELALAEGKEEGKLVAWSIGIAINRMLDGLEIPEKNHAKDCQCSECIKRKVDEFMGKESSLDQKIRTLRSRGKVQATNYSPDVVIAVAEFTGHEVGCTCVDCQIGRTEGTGVLCADCKHYYCECNDESEDK